MDRVDVENAEEHFVLRHTRNEAEDSDDEQNYTKKNRHCFNHVASFCVETRDLNARRSISQALCGGVAAGVTTRRSPDVAAGVTTRRSPCLVPRSCICLSR